MTLSEGSKVLGRKEAGVERVLVEPEKLAERVRELASQIDSWYPAESPILIGVLNGAVVFMTELMQAMTVPVSIDFMAVSSYGSSTQSSGVVQILKDLSASIQGRDVLVVEDIVDSGLTLQYLLDYWSAETRRACESLRYCGRSRAAPWPFRSIWSGSRFPTNSLLDTGWITLVFTGIFPTSAFCHPPQLWETERLLYCEQRASLNAIAERADQPAVLRTTPHDEPSPLSPWSHLARSTGGALAGLVCLCPKRRQHVADHDLAGRQRRQAGQDPQDHPG